MRTASWLMCTGLLVASLVAALAGSSTVLADARDRVTFTGVVLGRPDDVAGTWVIGVREVEATESTILVEAAGPADVDALVFVEATETAEGDLQADLIRVQAGAGPILARLRLYLTSRVQALLGHLDQLSVRLRSQARTGDGTGVQSQTRAETQLHTQTQAQAQDSTSAQTQAQDQTRSQDQTCTQDETQTREQTQPQDQTRTRAGNGGPGWSR